VAGVPVLGLSSNMDQMDQFMNMEGICRAKAGELLRAGTADAIAVRAAVTSLISEPRYREAASHLSRILARYDGVGRFRSFLGELFPKRMGTGASGQREKKQKKGAPLGGSLLGFTLPLYSEVRP
jgi:UDP:flavonoid glycosyltransferase YjiC (YdhE family)